MGHSMLFLRELVKENLYELEGLLPAIPEQQGPLSFFQDLWKNSRLNCSFASGTKLQTLYDSSPYFIKWYIYIF
jgi:hypothetical protein